LTSHRGSISRRVAVIGLDCADPTLVFDRYAPELPNLRRLMSRGTWGPLRSVDPPITVPAWSCMMSGRDPGELGIYGFRNRIDHSYDGLRVADSRAVTVDRVWDRMSAAGKHVIVVGVPGTSPPVAVNGELVSCFLTGDPRTDPYTHPAALRTEVEALVGPYQVDVRNFRSDDRDRILAEVYAMTDQRFNLCRHLLDTRPWDFFMMVEIGLDRMHHAFWRFSDPEHPRYEPNHRYRDAIRNYYAYLDDEIGELLERFDDDDTVLIVSDHGARPMHGAICVNEWLAAEGYLATTAACASTSVAASRRGWSTRASSSHCATSWPRASSACPDPTATRSARARFGPMSCGASSAASRPT
jgi:predicted AlkP superfamily phosphohydrolase/phosphomutase